MEKLPRLRNDIQLLPAEVRGRRVIALKDMRGINDAVVALQPHVAHFLPFFDGEHSISDLQQAMMRMRGNQLVLRSEAEEFVRQLDALFMLESPAYLQRKREVRQQFAELASRPAALAGPGYPPHPDEALAYVREMLDAAGAVDPSPPVRALIAPHIDLRVGGSLYGRAYARLKDQDYRRLIVIGTGHALDDGLFSVTGKRYETPLGSFPADPEAVERLKQAGGGCLAPDDFAHRVEHSIEFQVLFLRAVLKREIPLLPILAGNLAMHLSGHSGLAEVPGVAGFLDALRELCGPGALIVAGVDFCHVGPKFGHPEPATSYEEEIREHDRRLLEAVSHGSAQQLWAEAQRVQDRFNVCGLSTLVTLLELMPGAAGQILGYEVWHEAPTHSAVSYAAAVLT